MEVRSHGKEPSMPNSIIANREAQPATPSIKLPRRRDASSDDTNTNYKNGRDPDPDPIKYRECLRNHAASIGGHVMDGCGEFMPGGEEGTSQALKCAACDCHRNFHRKEIHHFRPLSSYNSPTRNNKTRKRSNGHGPSGSVMMAFGGAVTESSSEDLIINVMHPSQSQQRSKKRFRTKFNQEQKSRMMGLAEKLEWKIQKQNEEEVAQFCSQVGIQRQVFKVWMHNNKQATKKQQQQPAATYIKN